MAAPYKVTWFFEGLQQNSGRTASSAVGWTESWYGNFNSVDAALAEGMRWADNSWLGLRTRFLHPNYVVRWARASRATGALEVKVGSIGVAGGADEGHGSTVATQVTCCILVDFVALPIADGERAHHRRVLLRGLTQDMINGNLLVETTATYQAMINWCNYIGRSQLLPIPAGPLGIWQIRFQAAARPFVPITLLVTDPTNVRRILVTAGLPLAGIGAKIVVRGVTDPRGVNRVWTVQAPAAAGGPYLLGQTKREVAGPWSNAGFADLVSPDFRAPSQYLVVGLRLKKTGRPFRLTRGRRQAS